MHEALGNEPRVTTMESWTDTAREVVKRSQIVRAELREEAKSMLANDEYTAAKRIFDDILEERLPVTDAPTKSVPASGA